MEAGGSAALETSLPCSPLRGQPPRLARASLWDDLAPTPPATLASLNQDQLCLGAGMRAATGSRSAEARGSPGAGRGGVRTRGATPLLVPRALAPAWQLWGGLASQAPPHLECPHPGASLTPRPAWGASGEAGNLACAEQSPPALAHPVPWSPVQAPPHLRGALPAARLSFLACPERSMPLLRGPGNADTNKARPAFVHPGEGGECGSKATETARQATPWRRLPRVLPDPGRPWRGPARELGGGTPRISHLGRPLRTPGPGLSTAPRLALFCPRAELAGPF